MQVARDIAQRSLCARDRVGAVIVSATNRIIDTGYNGPPARWTRYVGDGASTNLDCSFWCPRAGANGYDIDRTLRVATGLQSDYDDCFSLHAEANALMFSERRLREGGTIYVTSGTCGGCAKLVANSGLARAIYGGDLRPHRDSDRWYGFLRDCGLEVMTYAAA